MFERIRKLFSHDADDSEDEPLDDWDDRDAGIPVQVRRRSPDHGSSVAVTEPEEDE
ncbi:MAG TPA: hypothetical protein VN687_08640 [Blastocatellia bacterium]|nr:hypothetical protein [Blastocatellia bacterium]